MQNNQITIRFTMDGIIIVFAHQKGGVGKSTIASNLAVELSKEYKVSILDLDVQKTSTAFATRRKKKLNLEFVVLKTPGNPAELVKVMNDHKDGILLIDTGGYDFDLQRVAMFGADMIITPVSKSPIELHGLTIFAKTLKELKGAKKSLKANVLFNRVHHFASKSILALKKDIAKLEVFNVFDTVITTDLAFEDSFFFGQSVGEFKDDCRGARNIDSLIDEIKNNIEGYHESNNGK